MEPTVSQFSKLVPVWSATVLSMECSLLSIGSTFDVDCEVKSVAMATLLQSPYLSSTDLLRRLIFLVIFSLPTAAQTVCPPTPAWSLCEITFPSDHAPLQAEFRSPGHRTFLIHSFSDGQKQILRIVPTEPGTWDFRIDGKEGSFTATGSDAPGYVEAANVHHFRYTGSKQPHLWAGGINHVAVAADQSHDAEIVSLHKSGKTADLIIPPNANLPELVARYGALNITWQVPPQPREIIDIIKSLDQYQHLIDYRTYRSSNGDEVAIEHQTFPVPFVNYFSAGNPDADQFRKALWQTTLDGAYPESQPPNDAAAAQLKHWYDFFAQTRHWELEPFFDADGRHALALEGVEYVVYVEQPGTVNVTVEKHNYDVAWFNPASGERIDLKNLKTEIFTGEPPDNKHDWVLHISREGQKAGMLKSYKFESREILQQEVEAVKVPYEIAEPTGDSLSLKAPGNFAVKLTKDTKAARAMRYLWTGEVSADGQGLRVLGTGKQGQLVIPADIAKRFPALLHLRVEGLNGVGKLYTLDRNYQLTP